MPAKFLPISALVALLLVAAWIWTREGSRSAVPSRSSSPPAEFASKPEPSSESPQDPAAIRAPSEPQRAVPQPASNEPTRDSQPTVQSAESAEVEAPMGDLLPSRAVTFSIFDPRGAPIASAPLRIDLRDEVETSAEYLYSDEKGAVRVKLSPDSQLRDPFDLRIEVNGGDHAGCVLSGLAFGSLERLELGTVTLTTPREDYDQPLAAGFVRTPEGTAVPDLKASFYTDAEDPQTRSWPTPRSGQVVVEADGRFAAYGQEGTKRGSLQFTAEGREGVYLTNIDLPETGLDVVMARLLELRGRLVVPEGWPAPNEFGIAATGGDVSTVVRVKQDGTFSAPLPLNLSEFEVRYPMGGSMRVHSESFTIGNDDSVDVGTIELDEVARLYEIRVTDPLGEPIRNEPLRAELDGETLPWTFFKTDAQGLFRFVAANDITEVSVGLYSAEKITIDLVSPPERLELPRP